MGHLVRRFLCTWRDKPVIGRHVSVVADDSGERPADHGTTRRGYIYVDEANGINVMPPWDLIKQDDRKRSKMISTDIWPRDPFHRDWGVWPPLELVQQGE